ncbi:MAG: hypothetical protein M5R36_18540 [Deltaproteobacteria bacterium]|nr:hypothetical protein [Deltaproteobacteria bacterium]
MTTKTPKSRATLRFFLVAAVVLALGFVLLPFTGPVDDAYITMTYSRHLAHGQGLVFNPGENVEGSTAFGQVIILAVFSLLGIVRIDFVAVLLGILAWAGALTLGYRLYVDDRGRTGIENPGTMDFVFFGFLISCPMSLVWAASAMETPIVGLLWMLALTTHLREIDSERVPWASALATAVAGLMRPDGILVAVVLGLSWLWPFRKKRALRGVLYGVMVLGLFGGYWLWRWRHLGYFTPNTYAAKVGDLSIMLLLHGIIYVLRAGMALVFPPVFLILIVGAGRKLRAELPRWFWIGTGLTAVACAYAVSVGGDFFPYHRFLVPVLIPGTLAAWKLFRVVLTHRRRDRGAAVAPPARKRLAVLLVVGWWLWATGSQVLDLYKANKLVEWTRAWVRVGRQLRAMTPEDTVIATLPIGAVSYFSHRRIIDMVGLTDLHIGRSKQRTGVNIVGHEKFDTAYVLKRRPHLILSWPELYRKDPKVSEWRYAHTIGMAQRDLYLRKRTFDLYTPVEVKIAGRTLFGLMRSDLLPNPEFDEFKPLATKRRRKYFDPDLFRVITKPSWDEAFESLRDEN